MAHWVLYYMLTLIKKGFLIMKNKLYLYNENQKAAVEEFYENEFGCTNGSLFHEIKSEYVHTDTYVIKSDTGDVQFITCGMSAREMDAPDRFKRCEIAMVASKSFDETSTEGMTLVSELVRISKFPFENDTWLGKGHTVGASDDFKKVFGYDAFAFKKSPKCIKIPQSDEVVNLLVLIPIYKEEREWCMKNHTLGLLEELNQDLNGNEIYADVKREMIIPEDLTQDEIEDYDFTIIFDTDKETFIKLCEFIEKQEQNDVEITNELIEKWLKENK